MEKGTIQQLASFMRDSRAAKEPPYVLILGAGASKSSGAPTMPGLIHQFVQKCDPEKARGLTGDAQWDEEFYRLIESPEWSKYEGYNKLRQIFLPEDFDGNKLEPSSGYKMLATMVKDKWFDLILTFNIDPLLERALRHVGLHVGITSDDEVALIDPHSGWRGVVLDRLINRGVKVVKLHGDIGNRTYQFRPTLDFPPEVKDLVERSLAERGAVIVGYSMRDLDFLRAFQCKRRNIWYVNPRDPREDSHVRTILVGTKEVGCFYICSEDGNFDQFFSNLQAETSKLVHVGLEMPPPLKPEAIMPPQLYEPARPYIRPRLAEQDEILSRVGFLNRFRELQEIKDKVSIPGYPPVTVVSGPIGYGKTYLLREVAQDLQREGWDYTLLECEKYGARDIATVRNALASECGCDEVTDWADIGACLGQRITAQQPYKVALLLDGIDWLSRDVRHQVLVDGLPAIYDAVRNAWGVCRIVLSGRCVRSDLARASEEIRARGDLPFGRSGAWYSEISLSEFGQDVISDLIRRVSQRDFEPDEYQGMTGALLELTGGHPRGLVRIVAEDLHKRRGWAFGKRPGTRGFYFNRETNERLFTTYMNDVVAEIKARIGEQWWEDLQTVYVLRKFDADRLQRLMDKGAIRHFSKGNELLNWLLARGLIREKEYRTWGDAIARGVVLAEMKMLGAKRERYGNLNRLMAESYSELLDRVCRFYEETHISELESSIVTYAVELIYHRLEAIKYLEISTEPKTSLEKVLEEVCDKLTRFGSNIVQQFTEEIKKDKEICPSGKH